MLIRKILPADPDFSRDGHFIPSPIPGQDDDEPRETVRQIEKKIKSKDIKKRLEAKRAELLALKNATPGESPESIAALQM